MTDASPVAETWQLVIYLAVALLMVLALRIVVHMALLREKHDPITKEPLLCEDCGHVVPDMAFCPACGLPPGSYVAPPVSHTSHRRLLLQLAAGVGVLIVAAVVVFKLLTPPTPRYVCPIAGSPHSARRWRGCPASHHRAATSRSPIQAKAPHTTSR